MTISRERIMRIVHAQMNRGVMQTRLCNNADIILAETFG